jgi:membrane associated rhomboid family serine protease
MLILGDKGHYNGRFPKVTVSLVVVNVVVFAAQIVIGDRFTVGFSLVPEEITTFQDLQGTHYRKVWVKGSDQPDRRGYYHLQSESQVVPIKHYPGPVPIWLTLFTAMFMHGGILHLVFNMWYLLIFGRNVECAMGHRRFFVFYMLCGVLAGLAHVASDPHSIIPCLGASGAIAGVMGAYLSIYPLNKIKIWIFPFGVFNVPALIVIGVWAILQCLSTFSDDRQMGGVAYWAHLGGFLTGFLILRLMVFHLRRVVAARAATKEKALAPGEPSAPAKPVASTDAKAAPDPYAGFITMQTIRRMQEKQNRKPVES